jgi:hypothetical protein
LQDTVAPVIGKLFPALKTVIFDCAEIFKNRKEKTIRRSFFIETNIFKIFKNLSF